MAVAEKHNRPKIRHNWLKVSIIPVLAAIITAAGKYPAGGRRTGNY
jgi:hypothetical protein